MSEKSTLADRLRENLADQIVNGELRPGTRLDEIELATKFGMSRTPVREAFKALAGMGLVEQRPHRGVVVALPSRKRLEEMFGVMAEIAATCARPAAGSRAGPEAHPPPQRHPQPTG